MDRETARQVSRGFWATSLATLGGRVFGLLRDMATAALFGLGEGGVMDAFVIAFRIPNLFRRLFGEGALATSFLPVFSDEYERDPRRAWQLLSLLLVRLCLLLSLIVLIGELACAVAWWKFGPSAVVGLIATLLPYLVMICMAAQLAAALQARMQFAVPAMASSLLNVCWLFAAAWLAPRLASGQLAQGYILAAAVLLSGVLQIAVQLPTLYRLGFHFQYDLTASRAAASRVGRSMLPISLGLAVTQLNTLIDTLIAWGLSAPQGAERAIAWLGGLANYPMETGAAAAIYFGERFYQLPVGLLGIAVATVVYPRLAQHAAQGDRRKMETDLSFALRLVWVLAIPAQVGIMLLARPLVAVLFEHGQFSAQDSARAAGMVVCYASGIWAYCALPVLVRGFYALGDRQTPMWIGLRAVGVNLALNLTLVWFLAERGLAVSTSVAAGLQVILLAGHVSRTGVQLDWAAFRSTFSRSLSATTVMALAVMAIEAGFFERASTRAGQMAVLGAAIAGGAGIYLTAARLLGLNELSWLLYPARSVKRTAEIL